HHYITREESSSDMGDFDGQVVYITGVARGQGRKHAIRFAREGAKIIGMDLCAAPSEYVRYPTATEEDLAATIEKVEAEGGEILAEVGDVRDLAFQQDLVTRGVERFGGRLDVVIANAGICNWGRVWEIDEQQWQDTLDINLTGYWKTLKATIPHMLEADNGGSIILVSSVAGLKAMPVQSPYSASKHGVVGLAQTAAKELGEHRIRVNTIHPYGVLTPTGADGRHGAGRAPPPRQHHPPLRRAHADGRRAPGRTRRLREHAPVPAALHADPRHGDGQDRRHHGLGHVPRLGGLTDDHGVDLHRRHGRHQGLSAMEDAPVLAVLPLGATEQHGAHLPTETDTLLAAATARAVAGRGPTVLPALAYGASGEHQSFPGTVSIG